MAGKRWMNTVCWCLSVLMLVALGIQYFSPWRWVIGLGSSVSGSLALMETRAELATRAHPGEYVVLRWQGVDPNRQPRLKQGMKLIKRIACGPGQRLLVTAHEAICDGRTLGAVRDRNLKGQPLNSALYDGIVPQGRYFVMGDHPASYDSRYLGLISESWIVGRLVLKL